MGFFFFLFIFHFSCSSSPGAAWQLCCQAGQSARNSAGESRRADPVAHGGCCRGDRRCAGFLGLPHRSERGVVWAARGAHLREEVQRGLSGDRCHQSGTTSHDHAELFLERNVIAEIFNFICLGRGDRNLVAQKKKKHAGIRYIFYTVSLLNKNVSRTKSCAVC